MKLFQTRRPRPFSHKMIYADERRERVKDIERRARRELGMPVADERNNFSFGNEKHNITRRRGLSNMRIVVYVIALILLLWFVGAF